MNTTDKLALLKLRARLLEAQSKLELISAKILIQEDHVASLKKELRNLQNSTELPCVTPGEPK